MSLNFDILYVDFDNRLPCNEFISVIKQFFSFNKIYVLFNNNYHTLNEIISRDLSYLNYFFLRNPHYGIKENTLSGFSTNLFYRISFHKNSFFTKVFTKKNFKDAYHLIKEIYQYGRFLQYEKKLFRYISLKARLNSKTKVNGYTGKKILFIISHLNSGGAERQLVNLSVSLIKLNYHVAVCIINKHLEQFSPYENLLNENKIPILDYTLDSISDSEHFFFISKLPRYIRKWTFSTYAAVKKFNPDVVHSFMDWSNIATGISCTLLGHKNVIFSFRGTSPNNYPNTKYWFRRYYKILLQNNSIKLSCNSKAGINSYKSWLNIKNKSIILTPNIISNDFKFYDRNNAIELINHSFPFFQLSEKDVILGSIIRLESVKCPFDLIMSLSNIKKQGHRFKAVIVGDGPLYNDCNNLISELSLEKNVLMVGKSTDVSLFYSVFSFFILCSKQEGTPNVLIEAQMYGIPCITTNVGSCTEIISNGVNGIVLKTHDINELTHACISLINNSNRINQYSKNAHIEFKNKYSKNTGLDVIKKLYSS